jgi:uncharacterized protein YndB with AHSA1/START domain/DNA-binding transcriptional ArsR family regulator
MDDVFKALADPSRRILLDALFREDGQTMTELQAHLEMSRFGVMKHLQILERAGLITSTKVGRERRHYLNPIPIQQVYDRWVSKYAGAWTGALTRLKYELEDTSPMADTMTHVYEIFIRTTPDRLWQALTDGDQTAQYYFGTRVQNITDVGANYQYTAPDGSSMLQGKVLEVDPPRKLVTTFIPGWVESPQESTVSFEITPDGEVCKLTLRHERLIVGDALSEGVKNGWARIFSSLKSLLESGEALPAEAM